jgi:outer membrane protein assembly factor BamE
MRKLLILGVCAATQLTAGCSGEHIPFAYRLDIPQGNVVTQDMVNRLEPGMSKQQVTYVMGTPLIVDTFHPDEWIYLYYVNKGGERAEERRINLLFDHDRLARVTGDVRTGGQEEQARAVTTAGVEVPLQPAEEPSLWQRIKRSVGLGEE